MKNDFNFTNYQRLAGRTARPSQELRGDIGATKATVDVLIAAGNLADVLKRQIFYRRKTTEGDYLLAIEDIRIAIDGLESSIAVSVNAEDALPYHPRIFHGVIGAIGEEAEMLEALSLDDLDHTNIVEEAGDGLWYQAEKLVGVQELTGVCPADVAAKNISKLVQRYPDEFNEVNAAIRDIEAERVALES